MYYADIIFINGEIITLEADYCEAKALCVKNEKIVYVGNETEAFALKGPDTKIINLNGKTLMPGFIETHAHPLYLAQSYIEVNCSADKVKSISDILQLISERTLITEEGDWILGRGWDDSKLDEKRRITKEDLDKVSPNHPVYLKRACGHVGVANSLALKIGEIEKYGEYITGGRIGIDKNTGSLNGILEERGQELLPIPEYSIDQLKQGLLLAQNQLHKWGITTIHDMASQKRELKVYQSLLNSKEISLRYRLWLWALPDFHAPGVLDEAISLGIESGFGNDYLKVQGMKFMLDGSIGGKTAAREDNYPGEEQNGILYRETEQLVPYISKSLKNNLRVSMHAIGERAIDQALNLLQAIKDTESISLLNMRNRIEHATFATEEHVQMMKKLGVVVSSSTGFLYPTADNYIRILGEKDVQNIFPHSLYKKYGIIAPVNSDLPVVNGNPLIGMYSLVTRKTELGVELGTEHMLSKMEALQAYTIDGAYSSFEEDAIGSLKKGKLADLIITSDNPLNVKEEEIKDIKVLLTMVGGKIVYNNI